MGSVLSLNEDKILSASNNKGLELTPSSAPSVGTTTLVLKGDNLGNAVAATPGTDYVVPSALTNYIPITEKAANNGVATLDSSGKVPSSQLRSVFVISATAPQDTSLLWIDSNSVMRYYSNNAWHPIVPVWG